MGRARVSTAWKMLGAIASVVGLCTMFPLPVFAASTQKVCVVPDEQAASAGSCIKASLLREWLVAPQQRDADGSLAADTVVEFKPGTYRLRAPIVIDRSITGRGNRKLTLLGSPSDRTTLVGAFPIKFSESGQTVAGRGQIWTAKLSEIGGVLPETPAQRRFGEQSVPDIEVFFRNERLPRARWPNTGFGRIAGVTGSGDALRMKIDQRDGSTYRGDEDLMLGGYFFHDWADELIPARPLTDGAYAFRDKPPHYGVASGRRVWVENALVDIDQPGEWRVGYADGVISLLPVTTPNDGDIEVSVGRSALVVTGASNVEVRSFSISRFRQAGVVVDKGENIALRDLDVTNIGGDGIRIGGQNISLTGGHVSDTGGAGVTVGGGNRSSLAPGNIRVANMIVERVGRLQKTYRPAISLNGVGNVVEANVLRDGPHAAIVFHGNDHRIAGNLIERFVQETDDAGAIYTGQDWTERGTVIEGNVVRSTGGADKVFGANAIYLDDQASGITVRGNLIIGAKRGIFIGGGRDNILADNTMVDCAEGVFFDARGLVEKQRHGARGANQRYMERMQKVPVHGSEYRARYPGLAALDQDEPGAPKGNLAERNLFLRTPAAFVTKQPAEGFMRMGESRTVRADTAVDWSSVTPEQIDGLRTGLWKKGTVLSGTENKVIK